MSTLKQLKKAGKEINVLFENEAIDVNGDEAGLTAQLKEAMGLLTDDDEVSEETQAVLDEIEAAGKKPTRGVKKPEPVEEAEEEAEEAEEEESLVDQITGAAKIAALQAIVEKNDEFKKIRKSVAKFKTATILKQAMLDILSETADEAEEAPKAEKKVAKPAKEVDPNAPKKKNPFIKVPGVLSFQETADKLLAEKADDKTIQDTFVALYKERKSITDAEFVKGRAAIYMKIAKKGKE